MEPVDKAGEVTSGKQSAVGGDAVPDGCGVATGARGFVQVVDEADGGDAFDFEPAGDPEHVRDAIGDEARRGDRDHHACGSRSKTALLVSIRWASVVSRVPASQMSARAVHQPSVGAGTTRSMSLRALRLDHNAGSRETKPGGVRVSRGRARKVVPGR
jgi:hypothetical protein